MPAEAGRLQRLSATASSAVRLVLALVIASICAAVLLGRVITAADPIRVKLTTAAARPSRGVVELRAGQARATDLRNLVVFIARLSNQTPTEQRFLLSIDSAPICEEVVPPHGRRRVDCVYRGKPIGLDSVASVSSTAPSWELEYLEVANLHGSSRGGLDLIIAPAGTSCCRWFSSPLLAGLLWTAIVALLLAGRWAHPPRALVWIHRILAGAIVLLFVAILVAPLVSPFSVLISGPSFVRALLLLTLPGIWGASVTAHRVLARKSERAAFAATAVLIASVATVTFGLVTAARLRQFDGNYSGFLQISRAAFEQVPFLRGREDIKRELLLSDVGGYDGQFMYFVAFDPLLRLYRDQPLKYRRVVDDPPYRFGRIGFSGLTTLFSAGRSELYPMVMIWLIALSHVLCALALSAIARHYGSSPAWALLIVLVPGFWQSARVGLPESLAAAGMLWGTWGVLKERYLFAASAFASSLLIRETGVILLMCLVAASFRARRDGSLLLATALLPLILWRLYVGLTFFSDDGWRAFMSSPGVLGAPFGGLVEVWRVVARGEYYPWAPDVSRAARLFSLLLGGAAAVSAALFVARRDNPVLLAGALYGLLAICLNYDLVWLHVGNAERVSYELFVVLAVASVNFSTWTRHTRLWIGGLWAASVLYVVQGAFEAQLLRGTLVSLLW